MLWGLAAIISGLVMITRSISLFYKSKQSLGWPSTLGKIVSLEVVTKIVERESRYEPRIRCEYTANGVQCVSNISHVRYPEKFASPRPAWRFLRRYSEGDPVRVYFNPEATEEAVLDPGAWEWFPLAAGIALVIVGIGLCYLAWLRVSKGISPPSEQEGE